MANKRDVFETGVLIVAVAATVVLFALFVEMIVRENSILAPEGVPNGPANNAND